MVAGNKIRIYDLARNKTPGDLDEKTSKKVQAEITRQVIKLSPQYSQFPKTASSSIDTSAANAIMESLNLEEIISSCQGGKSPSSSSGAAKPKIVRRTAANTNSQENKEEEKPAAKPKLKIVRRIVRQEVEEEKEEDKLDTPAESPSPSASASTEDSKQDFEDDSDDFEEEEDALKDDKNLQAILKSTAKPHAQPSSPAGASMKSSISELKNVRSIPLRPTARPQIKPQTSSEAKPASGGDGQAGQPYRVAKPTSSSQGIGRKKKRDKNSDSRPKPVRQKVKEVVDEGPKEFTVTKPMALRELAHQIDVSETEVITYFFMKKIIKAVNDILEPELIIDYLESKGYDVYTEEDKVDVRAELQSTLDEDESEGNLISRPPVITIMGHVDHGKTTLVDTLRKTKSPVTAQESGGITQHISAYRIQSEDFDGNLRKITILDTPGHEAFTAMRARGATVTDIVVLVVAADDGVMPQTKECIKHIKDLGVPYLVAINKVDKPEANPDKVLGQLAEYEIITEDYGGEVQCSRISALNNENIDDLLAKVFLVADAEVAEKIQSNPERLAIGTVIEAQLSRFEGPAATVLVQNGTLRVGDFIAAGAVHGKVKAMEDETFSRVKEAGPSTAVKVLGLSGTPKAGDQLKAYSSIKEARNEAEEIAQKELEEKRYRGLSTFASEIKEGQEKELRIIIKADVQGSAEAISHELNKLSTGEVLVKPILIDSGSITTNDVQTAASTGAVIVGFHVGTDSATAKQAEKLGVKIKSYEIIYKLTEDLERAVLGMHAPEIQEEKLGVVEVRKIFTIDKRKIAGCFVTEGNVVRNEIARVFRDGVQIYEGKVDYLRRFKDDVKEVKEGFECGLSFEKYNDLQEGDFVECWTVKEIAKTKF